eukprot:1042545-Amphidinium_carterae.2
MGDILVSGCSEHNQCCVNRPQMFNKFKEWLLLLVDARLQINCVRDRHEFGMRQAHDHQCQLIM